MFLDLIDRLLSKNKFMLSSPSIPQLFRLIFLPRLFTAFLPLICNHISLCSLLHCLLFLTNMHHLKLFLAPRDQINHLLLLKFFVKKTKCSKLESIYRRCKTEQNKVNFKNQSKLVAKLITASKRSLYRSRINQHSNNPKKLWPIMNSLLSRTLPQKLPTFSSASNLATSFLNFFTDKVTKLSASFPSVPLISPHCPPPVPPPNLFQFLPATTAEVRKIILTSSSTTCCLDSIPTSLLKSCIDVLITPITILVNLSLSEGSFPANFKTATVRPLLKKHSLPHEDLSSYCPISNLNFVSKVLERLIHTWLTNYLQSFSSLCPFQSAYRRFHSTETALIRIHNDLALAINQQKVSALVLLDLSAAFDTIDHHILIQRLTSTFGISGSALSLLSSYLVNRSQFVSIGSSCSAHQISYWCSSRLCPWSSSLYALHYSSQLHLQRNFHWLSPLCRRYATIHLLLLLSKIWQICVKLIAA